MRPILRSDLLPVKYGISLGIFRYLFVPELFSLTYVVPRSTLPLLFLAFMYFFFVFCFFLFFLNALMTDWQVVEKESFELNREKHLGQRPLSLGMW